MASRQGNGRRIGGVINDLRPPRESVDLRRLWFGRTVYGGAYRSPRAAPARQPLPGPGQGRRDCRGDRTRPARGAARVPARPETSDTGAVLNELREERL